MIWRERLRVVLSMAMIAACFALFVIGGWWVTLTGGLLAGVGPEPDYCRDVPSSAADADLSVQLLVIMLVPGLIRLLLLRRHVSLGELGLVPVMLFLALGLLATMECGDLANHGPFDMLIWLSLAAYPTAAVLLMFVRWPKLILP